MQDQLVETYLAVARRRNLSPRTIRGYRIILSAYTQALDPMTVHPHEVEDWLDTRRHTSPQSRMTYVSAIAGLHRWMADELGVTDIGPKLIRPKLPKRLPRPAQTDDLHKAIAAAGPRMRAWLCLAAYQGFRCIEIAGLKVDDLVLDQGAPIIRLRITKGDKPRVVPLGSITIKALERHGIPESGFVFTAHGRKYPDYEVSRQGCEYLRSLGIHATMHQLRHWFGTHMYDKTRDLLLVADLMGHSNVATTAGYAKVVLSDRAFTAVEELGA